MGEVNPFDDKVRVHLFYHEDVSFIGDLVSDRGN